MKNIFKKVALVCLISIGTFFTIFFTVFFIIGAEEGLFGLYMYTSCDLKKDYGQWRACIHRDILDDEEKYYSIVNLGKKTPLFDLYIHAGNIKYVHTFRDTLGKKMDLKFNDEILEIKVGEDFRTFKVPEDFINKTL